MAVQRWPVLVGLGLSLAAIATGLLTQSDPLEGWHMAARWTARVGFPVFLLTYLASSLVRLSPGPLTKAVLRDRRWWGLGFAASHTVHLFALVTYLQISGEPRTLASLIPGGLAYVMIFAMAATSSNAALRALGPNWKRLHRFGIHYIWLIFTLAYAGRIMAPESRTTGLVFTTLALAALGVRLAARRRTKVPQPA